MAQHGATWKAFGNLEWKISERPDGAIHQITPIDVRCNVLYMEAHAMANIFDCVDALGPGKVVHVCEPSMGLRAVLVIDNVARGPAVGGLRMAPDVSVEECMRLARAMTLKNRPLDSRMAAASPSSGAIPACPAKARSD